MVGLVEVLVMDETNGSELDGAPGDVSSASRSTCTIPLSLAVAFVAVRFPPALDDEVVTW